MSKRRYPTNIIKQSHELLGGLGQITPAPAITGITVASFTTDVTAAAALETQIVNLEAQLNDKRTQRDLQFVALWDKMKRIRNLVKGAYGDDSTQYKAVGGTRLSDRKPYRRQKNGE